MKVGPYNIDLILLNSWGKSLSELARTKGSGFGSTWDRIRERELESFADQVYRVIKTNGASSVGEWDDKRE